jgi:hypothetical protein
LGIQTIILCHVSNNRYRLLFRSLPPQLRIQRNHLPLPLPLPPLLQY